MKQPLTPSERDRVLTLVDRARQAAVEAVHVLSRSGAVDLQGIERLHNIIRSSSAVRLLIEEAPVAPGPDMPPMWQEFWDRIPE